MGIHISDVAALVKADSAIDKEALSRVSSVYILKRFHKPMLPRELNQDLCSLLKEKQRFAVTLWLDVNSEGLVDFATARYQLSILSNKA